MLSVSSAISMVGALEASGFDISNIDESAIEAEYTNGVLKVTLPKKAEQQPEIKRIEIK